METRKICVIVINRANYGRVKSVLHAIQEHPGLELQLVVGSSMLLPCFGEAVNIVQEDGFPIHARVNFVVEGQTPATMAISAGLGIIELATVFENLQPDMVFVIADRYDALSAAVAAAYMNIPVAHLQGGEVSGSIDESVRHAITRLAHLHFPATQLSAERLIKMGEPPETVYHVGCPSLDLAHKALHIPLTTLPLNGTGHGQCQRVFNLTQPYLLVAQHPVTTEQQAAASQIKCTLHALLELQMPTILLKPNVDAGGRAMAQQIEAFCQFYRPEFLYLFTNFAPEDYIRILSGSACFIGNSSSALREGSFLGTPVVCVGNRQAGRERSPNVIDVEYDCDEIVAAVRKQLAHGRYERDLMYGDGHASQRIVDILATAKINLQKTLSL
ncbi:UDP-N-acetylglucosamine 2-epimerase [Candidatus Vecturithrix granuli]|uniref:UDP-N-acetylglucosamine 2-epimerase n=1 Tax=Vecturithrix granuli TaxID=1499967 RepID=A0A081C0Z3_VECG1|nr:UDP-N-acetylglucosamine 2-epimerase [Candidatus Vecturithrix granuli]